MDERTFISDIGFTEQVKKEQEKRGSRETYQSMVEQSDWQNRVSDVLAAFLAQVDSFYLATATADGQPYIQHRGGPRGFLKVIDEKTLGFADFAGNRQYISTGNLAENDKVHLFFMDYRNKQRIKLWGRAKIVEDDKELLSSLAFSDYRGRPERVFLITIEAWDVNCPKHIPQKIDLPVVNEAIVQLKNQIAHLEAENHELREFLKLST